MGNVKESLKKREKKIQIPNPKGEIVAKVKATLLSIEQVRPGLGFGIWNLGFRTWNLKLTFF
ncbi:hypothetical protein [Chitinophaga japonensis]|uniref:hypothetical protein n=1 Tax=Chitinophaga japonensis TaxID=104662 RepID=UPI0011A47FB9|nr:hypothetical protein [Chitinophaga japonensis]